MRGALTNSLLRDYNFISISDGVLPWDSRAGRPSKWRCSRGPANLIETLRKANEQKERFVEFEFAGEEADAMVFDRQVVMDAMDDILVNNAIPRQCSADVRDIWLKDK